MKHKKRGTQNFFYYLIHNFVFEDVKLTLLHEDTYPLESDYKAKYESLLEEHNRMKKNIGTFIESAFVDSICDRAMESHICKEHTYTQALAENCVTTKEFLKDIYWRAALFSKENDISVLVESFEAALKKVNNELNNIDWKMEEHYQSKFHNEFHEGSNPTVINEATFNAPIYIGVKRGDVPPKSVEDINTAIRKLIADGTLTEDKQWYAIYKVLSAHLSYPTDKKAFCEQIKLHKLDDISVPCNYDNWRKAQNDYAKLPANVDLWNEDNATGTKEKAMIKVAKELMKLLGLNC